MAAKVAKTLHSKTQNYCWYSGLIIPRFGWCGQCIEKNHFASPVIPKKVIFDNQTETLFGNPRSEYLGPHWDVFRNPLVNAQDYCS